MTRLTVFLWAIWFAVPGRSQVVVIAHRGEHHAHPENTLPAFQAAIDAGADFFEADVRTTADGRLVLMHDSQVVRTTDGHGAVREMSFDQIRTLDAGAKFSPRFAAARVPAFEEALALAHGKIGVYVDCKDVAAAALVASLAEADMLNAVVIYGGPEFLRKVQTLSPSLKVMPEAGSPAILQKLIAELSLKVAAFDAGDFKDAAIAEAKRAGVAIYVDRLGAADKPAGWQDAVDRGAAGIQTDRPAELVAYLRSRGLHR